MSQASDAALQLASAAQERTVYFEAEGAQLFGIITELQTPNGYGMLIIQGGDTVNVSLLRNRLSVTIARLFAAAGYSTLRFDYHGLGESSGVLGELRLSSPFAPDAIAAVECLRNETGIEDVFLLGACFSARTALSAAFHIQNISGIVMATPPSAGFERSQGTAQRMARDRRVGDYLSKAARFKTLKNLANPAKRAVYRRLFQAKLCQVFMRAKTATSGDQLYWVSEHFLDPLDAMVDRQVPVFIAFGVDDEELREFERAEPGRLGTIIARSNGRVDVVRDMPDRIHGFPTISGQNTFIEQSLAWVLDHTAEK